MSSLQFFSFVFFSNHDVLTTELIENTGKNFGEGMENRELSYTVAGNVH